MRNLKGLRARLARRMLFTGQTHAAHTDNAMFHFQRVLAASGSTASFAVRRIGALLQAGALRNLLGVPTSSATEREARRLGIPIAGADWHHAIDVTIDGAAEVDPNLDLIKGGGGALLRETIVAQASRRTIIVIDETKLSPMLGTLRAVPGEVLAFGWHSQARFLESLGARVSVRSGPDAAPLATDEGNLILDCAFGPVARPAELAVALSARPASWSMACFLASPPTSSWRAPPASRTRPARDRSAPSIFPA